MKTVKLINPESVNQIFLKRNTKGNEGALTLLNGEEEFMLANANYTNTEQISADKLKIKFGNTYTYELHGDEETILIEMVDYSWGMGILINDVLRLFFVFRSAEQDSFENFQNFPEIQILDFYENENIFDLSFLSFCKNIQHLYIKHWKNIKDVNPVFNLKNLKELELGIDFKVVQISPDISECPELITLKLNKSSNLKDLSFLIKFPNLISLDLFSSKNIKDFSPLSDLKDLKNLDLTGTKIKSLSPLKSLHQLTHLNISDCESVIDITDLKYLTSLKELSFSLELFLGESGVEIEFDWSAFEYLQNLEKLVLENHLFEDISFLEKLENIKQLELGYCHSLYDISGLRNLKYLNHLNLDETIVKDISPLRDLKNLEVLNINSRKLVDLSPIKGLSKLKILDLYNCSGIQNFDPLIELIDIEELNLRDCNLVNLDFLVNYKSIKNLKISGCKNLNNIDGLQNLNNFEALDFSGCKQLENIDGISKLSKLKKLDFIGCSNLKDITPLSFLENLEILYLSSCKNIISFDPLQRLEKLIELELSGTFISDITPISKIKNLQSLELDSCTKLTKVSPLAALLNLKFIRLDNCENIVDFHTLKVLPKLESIGWIETVACLYVLIGSYNVSKTDSSRFIDKPIANISLAKNIEDYVIELLLACENIVNESVRIEKLNKIVVALREVTKSSGSSNQRISSRVWSVFIYRVLNNSENVLSSCLPSCLSDLDFNTEIEPMFYTILTELADLPKIQPTHVPLVRDLVNQALSKIEISPDQARKIAPAAAVFYAGLGEQDRVVYWIEIGTSIEENPTWRDRIFMALSNFHSRRNEFDLAKVYLDKIFNNSVRDRAISSISEQMATNFPERAAELIQAIGEEVLRYNTAKKLVDIPEVLQDPSSILRLLLTLEQKPDELALLIERVLDQNQGLEFATSLRSILLPSFAKAGTASALINLVETPEIASRLSILKIEKEFFDELREEALSEKKELTAELIQRLVTKGFMKPEFSEILSNAFVS
jgi:Leucine-rich repeat (LRR) protein